METKNINIGDLIRTKLKELHLTPTALAKRLGYSVPGTLDIMKRSTMQTEVLQQICKALDHDFFQYYVQAPLPAAENKDINLEIENLNKQLTKSYNDNLLLKKENEYLKKIVALYEEKKS